LAIKAGMNLGCSQEEREGGEREREREGGRRESR
jgi:hypothetical protein